MEERELLWIGIISPGLLDINNLNLTDRASAQSVLYALAYSATEKYVDTLTDKQREALIFIRMLPEREYVEGIGAWVKLSDPARKVYIIDC